jgi:hypothetical protein
MSTKEASCGGGTYLVGYWGDGESYEEDAGDYDVSKYALGADLIFGDLNNLKYGHLLLLHINNDNSIGKTISKTRPSTLAKWKSY